jgi:hypothetical protein
MERWISGWEQLCIDLHFKLLHDGLKNPGQFTFEPDDLRFYTMLYQGVLDGMPIMTFVRFRYDLRKGEVDMFPSCHDPRKVKKKTEKATMLIKRPMEATHGKV